MGKVKLQLGAELDVLNKGELDDALAKHGEWEREAAYGLRHQDLPRMIGTPAGGVLNLGADQPDQVLCGPGAGWYWAVHRLSVDGLFAGSAGSAGTAGASVANGNFAAAPAAGANVATVTPAAGTYTVTVSAYIDGTAAAGTDDDNMRLQVGGVTLARIPVSSSGAMSNTGPYTITVNGGQAITANVIANATAGSVYHAQIIATPVPAATAAVAADTVKIYKETKYICTISATPGFATFSKGVLTLKPGDFLRVVGTGLTTTSQVEVYGEAISVPGPLMWKLVS